MVVSDSVLGLFLVFPIGMIGVAIAHYHYFGIGADRYRMMFKERILRKLIKAVEPSVSYEPLMGITEETFLGSHLFDAQPDRYACEELMYGMIGDTKVKFSEVHAETKHTRTNANGGSRTYWESLFQGVFFIADFHKEFRHPVSVMPDVAEKHFGWIGKKIQKLGGGLQTLENPEFEKCFVVRGVDAVETRYILTPSMQERLLELRGRLGKDLRVGFRDSHVWLAIPNETDWFEGSLKIPAGDRGQAMMLLRQLRSCFQIVEELDLNTRIWTKE